MTELTPATTRLLSPALNHSRYLARLFNRRPQLAEETAARIEIPMTCEEMQSLLPTGACSDDEFKLQLRLLRQRTMARLIVRELTGRCTLDEAVTTVSDLAEVAIAAALRQVSQTETRYGQPIGEDSKTVQELIVVGMGKLGGRELNVSSDIDLIFVYPENGETSGPLRIDNHDYFTRIGRRLIQMLADVTDEGFVFRVDMRLRPFGDSGPLVCSFAALENYLLAQGREWERYAWIKGRAITGDEKGLMEIVTPFVFRKYLDYGAYHSMRELHAQIRREVIRQDRADNIKLGPGGIREVEFICQVFQLIRGGRTRSLRQRNTRTILAELVNQGTLTAQVATELDAAYVFLRNLEHRIMYLDDAQTQMLPGSEDERSRIACSMGHGDWGQFLAALDAHRKVVAQHFEQIFDTTRDNSADKPLDSWLENDDEGLQQLAALGFVNPQEIRRRLLALKESPRYLQMSERNRHRLDSLLPHLLKAAASQPQSDITLTRLLDLLESIGRRESYLALLAEHPQTLQRLSEIYSASSWVSGYLTRHPILLDELLDPRLLEQQPDWPELAARLRRDLAEHAGDTEERLDILRVFQHSQIFRLAVQDIAGLWSVEKLSDQISLLADLILQVVIEQLWPEIPGRHRDEPLYAAIGYGKLGGKELGYASDLDLVFLYEDEHPDAGEIYARLTRRISTWLTTHTSAGMLYDIDLRLRPNGASGLLVSSLEAFEHYQRHSAWEWEHQALTRARFSAGNATIGQRFESIRQTILRQPRDTTKLRNEVVSMRQRMLETHPAKDNDVKHCRGGLVDIEFIVQYLILAHASQYPELTANTGTIALLGAAAERGLIPSELAKQAQVAYRELRHLQHLSRLNEGMLNAAMLQPLQTEQEAARALWAYLFGN